MTIEILNWGLVLSTAEPMFNGSENAPVITAPKAEREREIHCDVTGMQVMAKIYQRGNLPPGVKISGPALIQEPQTTTLVSTGFQAQIDMLGNILLNKESQS